MGFFFMKSLLSVSDKTGDAVFKYRDFRMFYQQLHMRINYVVSSLKVVLLLLTLREFLGRPLVTKAASKA